MPEQISAGDRVLVTDAAGREHAAVAVSPMYRGRDMPLVAIQFADAVPMPWPAEFVRLADLTGAAR